MKQGEISGKTVATLDVDDVDSFGPETITLTLSGEIATDGVFRYLVHNYSNLYDPLSEELSLSGASVRIYKGNNLVRTYNVPVNMEGTLWTVFEIRDGNLYQINTITYLPVY